MSHAYGPYLVLRTGWHIGLSAPRDNPNYVNLLDRFPNVKWVIGHKGGGPRQIPEASVEACRDLPNVWLETAASSSAAGAFEYVVDTVGDDRVIYGSDVPLFDQRNEVRAHRHRRHPRRVQEKDPRPERDQAPGPGNLAAQGRARLPSSRPAPVEEEKGLNGWQVITIFEMWLRALSEPAVECLDEGVVRGH